MVFEYWKQQLNRDEQKTYENLCESFSRCKETADCGNIQPERCQTVYQCVMDDHPEFFQISPMFQIEMSGGYFGMRLQLRMENIFNASDIRNYTATMQKIKESLVKQFGGKSDFEKERGICEYILEHTTYAIDNKFNQNAATVLVKGVGQCSGIARAFKLMCDWLDLKCLCVSGSGNDGKTNSPHSWNIVQIEGNWHHVDATFMLGANTTKRKPFRLLYLNYSDEEISKNHSWQKFSTPKCGEYIAPTEPSKPVPPAKREPVPPARRPEPTHHPEPPRRPPAPFVKPDSVTKPEPSKPACDCVVTTLPQLHQEIRKALSTGKKTITMEVKLFFKGERLKKEVENCCAEVVAQLGKKTRFNVEVVEKTAKITWLV